MVHTVMGWIDNGEEPDYADEVPEIRCDACGEYFGWTAPGESGPEESYYGDIVQWLTWECPSCGETARSEEVRVGKVYGPLPPWSDPAKERTSDGRWVDTLAF